MDETMLGGRYRRVRPLGRGAMGEVWLAEDSLLHRHVAVKSVSSSIVPEPADLARVIREARLAAQLNHPNAVAVYDVIVVGERPYVVMEYVSGPSLAELIATAPMEAAEVGRIGMAVAEALGEAHRIGLVHRDIKPANIMVTTRGVPKIADFGIARLADDAERSTTGLTIGTPAYLSPELARGGTADARSDIWALGVTLYAALDRGHSPFQQPGDNAYSVIARLAASPVAPEPSRGGALTPTIMRMLATSADRRPTADTVVDMLGADLAAGRSTHQWSLPPYALAPPMPAPASGVAPAPAADETTPVARRQPVHDARTARAAGPPPVSPPPVSPPPVASPTQTSRAPLPLFDDDWDDDDPGDRRRTAPPRRRRRVWPALLAAVVVVAAALTAVVLYRSHTTSSSGSGGRTSSTPSGSGGSTTATPAGTAYTGAGGITVFGPPGWTHDESAGIASVDDYVAPGSTDHNEATFFRLGIGNARPKSSFDDQVQEEVDYLTGATNPYKNLTVIGGVKRFTFLGAPAADFEYTGDYKNLPATAPGVHRHVLLRIWTVGGVQREIVLIAIASQWETYKPVFDQLVAHAKVT